MDRAFGELTCDFLLMADRAEVVNGKLYLMGGAWDRLNVADLAQSVPISVAIGVLVQWNATNRQHHLRVHMEDADGREVEGFGLEAGFVAGRPPQLMEGDEQRMIFAIPAVPVRFPRTGKYALVVALNGSVARRTTFSVVAPTPDQRSGVSPAGA